MILLKNRLERERIIVHAMIRWYCRNHHGKSVYDCEDCQRLKNYTAVRLEKCKFGNSKPVCKECPVHCYSPEMREKIREVMRKAGPHMIYRHPLYAVIHLIDNRLSRRNK